MVFDNEMVLPDYHSAQERYSSVLLFKEILEKMKLREQRKQELSNRKSLAAKERMRILTKLADSGKCKLALMYISQYYCCNHRSWKPFPIKFLLNFYAIF